VEEYQVASIKYQVLYTCDFILDNKRMTSCGYICPKCEGRGYTDTGEDCDWCSPLPPPVSEIFQKPTDIDDYLPTLLAGKF